MHTNNFKRPFSTKEGGDTLLSKRKELQTKASIMKIESAKLMEKPPKAEELAKKDDKGVPNIGSVSGMSMGTTLQHGRSIHSSYHLSKVDSIKVKEPVIVDPKKLKGALPEFKEKEVPNPYCIKTVE